MSKTAAKSASSSKKTAETTEAVVSAMMEATSLDTGKSAAVPAAQQKPVNGNGNGNANDVATDDESVGNADAQEVAGHGDSAKPVANGVVNGNGGQARQHQQQADAGGGPDPQKLSALLERTGLEHSVTVGQRRLGPATNGEQAALDPTGREVFVGHLPRGMFEDQLYELFSTVGKVCDVRVMVDPSTGCGRGFGFVCYADKNDATKAVEKFNGYEADTRRHLQVNITKPNLRLFVGNVPKTMSREQLLADFQSHLDGVVDVIVTSPWYFGGSGGANEKKRKNRGFCFVEFDKHSAASAARRRLQRQPRIWAAAAEVCVDWADPLEEPDSAALENVRAVYVRGLAPSVTEQQLTEAFSSADCGPPSQVRLIRGEYGFVHFASRDAALRAVESLNGTELAGCQLAVSLARPVSERARQRKEERRMARYQQMQMMPAPHHFPPQPPHPQHPIPPLHYQHPYVPAPLPPQQQPQPPPTPAQVSTTAQIPQQPLPQAPPPPPPPSGQQPQQNPSAVAMAQYAAAAAAAAAAAGGGGPMIAVAPGWYGPAGPLPDPHQAYYAAAQPQAAIPYYQQQPFHPHALHPVAVPMPQHAAMAAPVAAGPQPVVYPVQQQPPQSQRGHRVRQQQQQQFYSPQQQYPPHYSTAGGRPGYVPGGAPPQRGAHTYLSVSSNPN